MFVVGRCEVLKDGEFISVLVVGGVSNFREGVTFVAEDEVANVEGGKFDDDDGGRVFFGRDGECIVDDEVRVGLEDGRDLVVGFGCVEDR